MDTVNLLLKCMIFLTTIPGLGALTVEECETKSITCQEKLITALQKNESMLNICNDARTTLSCVQKLECRSEFFMRIVYRTLSQRLQFLRIQCELGVYFPSDRAVSSGCQSQIENCTYNYYVDLLLQHDVKNNSRNETLLCQDLTTFTTCRLSADKCQVDKDDKGGNGPATPQKVKEEILAIAEAEKERLRIPDCSIYNHGMKTHTSPLALLVMTALTIWMIQGHTARNFVELA